MEAPDPQALIELTEAERPCSSAAEIIGQLQRSAVERSSVLMEIQIPRRPSAVALNRLRENQV
jgi:hypothetical protein